MIKETELERITKVLREMTEVQGSNGNWNYDAYMHGMYNGMEFMLSMVEGREPDFKSAPKVWLADLPKPDKFEVESIEND